MSLRPKKSRVAVSILGVYTHTTAHKVKQIKKKLPYSSLVPTRTHVLTLFSGPKIENSAHWVIDEPNAVKRWLIQTAWSLEMERSNPWWAFNHLRNSFRPSSANNFDPRTPTNLTVLIRGLCLKRYGYNMLIVHSTLLFCGIKKTFPLIDRHAHIYYIMNRWTPIIVSCVCF